MKTGHFRRVLGIVGMTLVFGLSIGVTCGGAADVDPQACCSTSGDCQPESGVSDPQSCCDREATSKTAAPNLQPPSGSSVLLASLPAARALGAESLIPLRSSCSDVRDAPLEFPPRDLVKLKASFLI